jgi:hypothetical protein
MMMRAGDDVGHEVMSFCKMFSGQEVMEGLICTRQLYNSVVWYGCMMWFVKV